MTAFLIGIFLGGMVGVLTMALIISGRDKQVEK
ncbi:DUF3789 domain-containing protein [Enterococcus dispar]